MPKSRNSVFRAYSIASAPSDNQAIELIIRQVPEACARPMSIPCSRRATQSPSASLWRLPLACENRNLIMIAGGSGLAPIRSLVLDILEKKLDLDMTFFFGAVTNGSVRSGELYGLQASHPNFHSSPPCPNHCRKTLGRGGWPDHRCGRPPHGQWRRQEAYLCGTPGMINPAFRPDEKRCDEDRIYYDKFA